MYFYFKMWIFSLPVSKKYFYYLEFTAYHIILITPVSLSTFMCVLSPSLECDSEEEDMLGHTYPCSSLKQSSVFQSSSGEERDTSPELNRTLSDSTHQSTQVHLNYTPFINS